MDCWVDGHVVTSATGDRDAAEARTLIGVAPVAPLGYIIETCCEMGGDAARNLSNIVLVQDTVLASWAVVAADLDAADIAG